ncbi:hypothetical protein NDU88_008141 [Pleurodeles waltl]|uniref:Uncharacterized protein n=1 Tax=Pleurodeles waltl TaxID=8319 RepID=A0AAV7U276_PLEWA|nr:hypothetical protein NDU88_008141 [Pleurodeles waltl]
MPSGLEFPLKAAEPTGPYRQDQRELCVLYAKSVRDELTAATAPDIRTGATVAHCPIAKAGLQQRPDLHLFWPRPSYAARERLRDEVTVTSQALLWRSLLSAVLTIP